MGSRLKTELAYIAGFLDGDGSIMAQIKKRNEGKLGFRIMLTICFYQDTRHAKPLYWIRDVFNIGYISIRNDGITELRVNGYKQVRRILSELLPYIRFKKTQAVATIAIASILSEKRFSVLTRGEKKMVADKIITIQKSNYKSSTKKRSSDVLKILGLTP